jgi:hypothetical protein
VDKRDVWVFVQGVVGNIKRGFGDFSEDTGLKILDSV